jgi:AcrR family transcriptional regulator
MKLLSTKLQRRIKTQSLNLFYELGYEKTSMRLIADKCHTSVGNLYRYYKGKEDLVNTLTLPVSKGLEAIIANIKLINARDLSDPALNKALEGFYDLAAKYPKLFVIYLEYNLATESDDVLTTFGELIVTSIETFIPGIDPVFAKIIYLYLMNGVIYILRLGEPANLIKKRISALVVFLFKDIDGRI